MTRPMPAAYSFSTLFLDKTTSGFCARVGLARGAERPQDMDKNFVRVALTRVKCFGPKQRFNMRALQARVKSADQCNTLYKIFLYTYFSSLEIIHNQLINL